MKKIILCMVIAELVLLPWSGLMASNSDPSAVTMASAAVAKANKAMQEGLAVLSAARKAAEQAKANAEKAQALLNAAVAARDKGKIKEYPTALIVAKKEADAAIDKLNIETALVDRLKVTLDKTITAAEQVRKATTPEEARAAAAEAQRLAERAEKILNTSKQVMKQHPPDDVIIKPHPHPTSTTQPSPTPIGRRG